jgi:hypothetical protein
VLDRDRAQLAGPHANKRERLRRGLILNDRETVTFAAGLPQPMDRRMEKPLPGMRPDGIAEERVIGAPLEPVSSAVLLIGPSDGQLIEMRDGIIDDRSVAHGRTNDR